jgi:hypothetical protein
LGSGIRILEGAGEGITPFNAEKAAALLFAFVFNIFAP